MRQSAWSGVGWETESWATLGFGASRWTRDKRWPKAAPFSPCSPFVSNSFPTLPMISRIMDPTRLPPYPFFLDQPSLFYRLFETTRYHGTLGGSFGFKLVFALDELVYAGSWIRDQSMRLWQGNRCSGVGLIWLSNLYIAARFFFSFFFIIIIIIFDINLMSVSSTRSIPSSSFFSWGSIHLVI